MKTLGSIMAVSVLALGLTACSSSGDDGGGVSAAPAASGSSASGSDSSTSGAGSSTSGSGSASGTASGAAGTGGCGKNTLAPGQSTTVSLESGGHERSYLVSAPKDYRADHPAPLVLAFHGRTRTSESMQKLTGFSDKPTIAVYPQALKGSKGTAWQGAGYSPDADDVKFTQDVLDKVESDMCVDTDKVFAAGMSNGGGFSSLLACRMSDRIAAFASVSGAYYEGTREGCNTADPAPLVEFHGTGDPTMHYDGGDGKGGAYISVNDYIDQWVARNQCAHEPEVEQATDGVEHRTYAKDCKNDAEVQHYRIDGGGHTWPGAPAGMGTGRDTPDLHATDLIWEFFQHHALSQRS